MSPRSSLRFDELSPREFEELCLALLRAQGHETRHLGAAGSDGGWDGRSVDPGGRVWSVQSKRVLSLEASKAVRELKKVLDDPEGEMPDVWALMATRDLSKDLEDKVRAEADGRCEVKFFGKSDLEGLLDDHPRVRDRYFAGSEAKERIAYLSVAKADRDFAAVLRRDLQWALRDSVGGAWNVKWDDPTEDKGLPEVPEAASWGLVLVSPEALADRQLLSLWRTALAQGFESDRRRLLAISVAPTPAWPDWLAEKFERVELRPESYRIDLSTIISKWIGETEKDALPSDLDLEGPGPVPPRLGRESYEALVRWLEPVMERDALRWLLAVSLGLDGMQVLDDFRTPALQASAAIVLSRKDDDPALAAKRLVGIAREKLSKEESADRLAELGRLAETLAPTEAPKAVDRGLLPAWLRKVRDDHTRLVSYFQQKHELGLLDRVYVELSMAPDRWREGLAEARMERAKGREGEITPGRPLGIEEVLALDPADDDWVTRRWIIRGDPGSGKTTLLRHLAARLAADEDRKWVPVFQSLPVLIRSGRPLLDRVDELFEAATELAGLAPVLEREGQEGRLLLLLDGLDEVSPEDRPKAESRLRELSQRWPDTPILVSTRPIGYRRFADDFRELELQPLDRDRRLEFLACWFGRVDGVENTDRAEAGLKQLESTGLEELTGNPLYLTLMAMLLEQEVDPDPNRSQLYHQVFTLLLEGKHKHEKVDPIERPGLVREALRLLAYTMTVDNRDAESKPDLEERLYREELLGIQAKLRQTPRWDGPMRHFLDDLAEKVGILGPHDGEDAEWKFWHRTFKEALTAEHLATLSETEVLEQAKTLAGQESRWAEPYALLTGQVKDADALVRQLIESNRDLGLRALATAQGVSDETLDEILELTSDPTKRTEVFERIPTLVEDAERTLKLIDRLRRRTRSGFDLYWLYRAAGIFAEQAEERWAEQARELQEHFYEHIKPPEDPSLFESFETADGEPKPLWCRIEAGRYGVGSPEGEEGRSDSEVRHEVELTSPIWVAAIPITNAQYAAFDPGKAPYRWEEVAEEELAEFPRTSVDWYEAVSFCRWLSTVVGLEGARLPGDAEWEVACRGGEETAYWSGNTEADLARVGWYGENSEGRAHRVAEKPANAFGLHDVHGNVWEWVSDEFDFEALGSRATNGVFEVVPASQPADLAAPSPRGYRVIRGGSYWGSARVARSAYRGRDLPGSRGGNLGFRVLLPFAPSEPR